LYELALALHHVNQDINVWVCSRGLPDNYSFFEGKAVDHVYARPVEGSFSFHADGSYMQETAIPYNLKMADAVLVRLPQPLNPAFLLSLYNIVPRDKIINDPRGTIETSSKEFLLNVAHLCPSPEMCYSVEDAIELSHRYEIVLKPLYSYAGRGILRLSTRYFWEGDMRYEANKIYELLPHIHFPMLAMRYLPNVSFGDKRTIVVNRQILGSALRMPPPDSWICNVAHGGHAVMATIDEAETVIEKELTPLLYDKGVIMYGFDTLLDDNGLRVLSEINTLSIGGLGPMEQMSGEPVLNKAALLLLEYLNLD
jgi:glutathione synthase